jgi:hypothetical protein
MQESMQEQLQSPVPRLGTLCKKIAHRRALVHSHQKLMTFCFVLETLPDGCTYDLSTFCCGW